LMDKEKSLFERISGDATMLGVSLTSIVVVVVLLWVVISRRRSNSANFQESILVSGMEDSEAEPMEGVPTGTTTQIAEETSFLSDFSPSDIGALQDETGEVDPLAEADVYIAYGRYQQAEKLIKQAIERNPERVELKHKLFEILFAVKDSDSFVALAEQSAAEGINKSDADIWLKVVAMGAQLASSHALFSGVDAPAPVNNGQVDAELNALEEDLGLGDGLDFDLPAETAAEDELGSFTLDDLNGFKEDALATDSGGDDLDLGVDNLTLPEADTSETAASGELEDTILDFSDVAETAGTGDQADDSFDGLGLNLDAGEAATDLETSLSLSDVEEFESTSLSTGETDEIVDEVNTKLDLARAYVDLGDVEGARSILEEVLGGGNQGQQQEAQQLLDQLT
ncbi:MAG: FimV/HubP family polar landmark protein, partial [Sedimenticolaceae bacterium]